MLLLCYGSLMRVLSTEAVFMVLFDYSVFALEDWDYVDSSHGVVRL